MNKEQEKLLLLKPKNNLEFEQEKLCCKADILAVIQIEYKGMNLEALKLDSEFLKHVCCLVETRVKNKKYSKYKIDKKALVMDALKILIPSLNSPEMIQIIEQNIENLHDQKLIKALKNSKYYFKKVVSFVSKNLL
jgi:hypothetical protein